MRPEDRDLAAVWDIVQAGRLIEEFTEGMGEEEFCADRKTHFAVIAQLQIIGEAAKRLSAPFREAHPSIPWRDMAGMRDVLIHLYHRVDLSEVWRVVADDISPLLAELRRSPPPTDP